MLYVVAFGVFVGMMLSACAPTADLAPAPQVQAAPDAGGGAVVEEAGVRVAAKLDAWRAEPADLETRATPVFVEIDNRSGRPLRLSHADFQLVRAGPGGFAPIAPGSLRGTAIRAVGTAPAARLGPYGAGARPDLGALGYDPIHIDRSYARVQRIDLPTPDMLQLALREGTVEPQDRKSGFLYFAPLARGTTQAVFQVELVDAGTGRSFGTVRIPFQTEKRG